ncbi:transcriptional regulator, LysR family [Dethiosulfovibrio peptidovorans DSM 11002]|uniref:Transcriptional regulator, LysR family n=1 Tax=Dethiosulfovibrio peptidovorans DSM 11002 TaxID=469381 RepID=D2Z6W7_9BACT|nr:LysR substrate-binding domain-containing protein [Dethiosulfovibrio peptidovorans]EFC91214.1 transcriptional regulator, LysR family [Dethiosulfovibrio peptidovorans DSM 11002]
MSIDRDVTIRQIEIFAEVARSGNLTSAAGRLGLSQSAASMALKELERLLDGPLFGRIGRGLVLNDRGRLLLPLAEDVLGSVRDFTSVGRSGDEPSGDLTVACSTTIANYLFPFHMKAFMDEYPRISLILKVGNTMEIEEEISKGCADIGLVEGELRGEHLRSEDWIRDDLSIFCSPQDPLARESLVSPIRLSKECWILREDGSGTLSTIMAALDREGVSLSRTVRIGHTEAIKRAVEAGMGISCLSRFAVEREVARGDLALVDTSLTPSRWFRIITHRRNGGGPAFSAMTGWLRDHRFSVGL